MCIRDRGKDVTNLKGSALSKFRREQLGFIFQDFNLLDTLTAYENIALALSIQNVPAREIEKRVRQVAAQLNIGHILEKFPYQMSGGEKQRTASARAIITAVSYTHLDVYKRQHQNGLRYWERQLAAGGATQT